MKINKAHKYRIYPNNIQKEYFSNAFGAARFIYNKMLEDKIKHYEITKEMLYTTPAQYKNDNEWMKQIDSLIFANVQLDLEKSYKSFFKNPKKFGFPNFKSKHKSKNTFKTSNVNNNIKLDFIRQRIKIPRIKDEIKIKMERNLPENSIIKNITISQTKTGKYFISIAFEYEKEIKPIKNEKYIGLDFSMPNLYVNSYGETGMNPKFFRNNQIKLAREQRKLSKMIKGSNNYKKQKYKIAKIHERIANKRYDFLHKESRKIANFYDVVCIESLNMQNMSKMWNFGKSVRDNGWGLFTFMLKYKLEFDGKTLVIADKWFPSTKQCSNCSNKKDEISLSERVYHCDICGFKLDRDVNAAINLQKYAMKLV